MCVYYYMHVEVRRQSAVVDSLHHVGPRALTEVIRLRFLYVYAPECFASMDVCHVCAYANPVSWKWSYRRL